MKLPVLAVPILRVSHRRPVPSHGVRKRRLEQVVILDQQHLHGDTQACAHMQAKRQEPPSVKKMKKTAKSEHMTHNKTHDKAHNNPQQGYLYPLPSKLTLPLSIREVSEAEDVPLAWKHHRLVWPHSPAPNRQDKIQIWASVKRPPLSCSMALRCD